MRESLRVFLILVIFSSPVDAMETQAIADLDCRDAVSASEQVFRGYLPLKNSLEMFVKIEKPSLRETKGWYLLVHGMLDSHRTWDGLVPQLHREGYGTIRMDLEGFARTLMRSHRNEDGTYKPLDEIKYGQQLANIIYLLEALATNFGIVQPNPVGHSMGGGLVLALLASPGIENLLGRDVYAISPYIYRLETWKAKKVFPLAGAWLSSIPEIRDAFERHTTDKVTTPYMKLKYTKFLNELIDERALEGIELSSTDRTRLVQAHVTAAINATRGLRGLNIVNLVERIHPKFRITHASGTDDHLIDMDMHYMLQDVFMRLNPQVYRDQLVELEGIGHMIPTEAPDQLGQLIIN